MTDQTPNSGQTSPKSILKKPATRTKSKSFQWDESNILATYHPIDKTYGHMKIDEAKTPFVYESDDGTGASYGASFTAEDLAAKLAAAASHDTDEQSPQFSAEQVDPAETAQQRQFREKRSKHYNEFVMAKQIQKSQEVNEDEEEEDAELKRSAMIAAENARKNARNPKQTEAIMSMTRKSNDRNRSRSPVRDQRN